MTEESPPTPRQRWTAQHSAEAQLQGWDVFSIDGHDYNLEIQKLDIDPSHRFHSDYDAYRHVAKQAEDGDGISQLAISLVYTPAFLALRAIRHDMSHALNNLDEPLQQALDWEIEAEMEDRTDADDVVIDRTIDSYLLLELMDYVLRNRLDILPNTLNKAQAAAKAHLKDLFEENFNG